MPDYDEQVKQLTNEQFVKAVMNWPKLHERRVMLMMGTSKQRKAFVEYLESGVNELQELLTHAKGIVG